MERIIEHAKHVIRSRFSLNEGQMLYLPCDDEVLVFHAAFPDSPGIPSESTSDNPTLKNCINGERR